MLALRFEWLAAPFHVALALYNGRLWMRHAHKTDVTEIFRQLPREKNIRIAKLVFYLVSFIYCIYRCASYAYVCVLHAADTPISRIWAWLLLQLSRPILRKGQARFSAV